MPNEKNLKNVDDDAACIDICQIPGIHSKFVPPSPIINCEKMLLVEVSDTGCGISSEKQSELFQQYSQLDPTKPGTGLGLSICKQLVELLSGDIGFSNNIDGKGATFWFKIPIINSEDQLSLQDKYSKSIAIEDSVVLDSISNLKSSSHHSGFGSQSTYDTYNIKENQKSNYVLVAEDNLVAQQILLRMLVRMKQNYIVTSDGVECYEAFTKHHDCIDTIILDGLMPKMVPILLTVY